MRERCTPIALPSSAPFPPKTTSASNFVIMRGVSHKKQQQSTLRNSTPATIATMSTRGERIQMILDEIGLSQADLAREMNVERATVNKWIHNSTSDMRLDNLLWLEDKYGYFMRWIISGKGPKKIGETLDISDLSDEAKKAIQTTVHAFKISSPKN